MSQLSFDYEGKSLKNCIEATDLRQVLDGYNRLVMDAAQLLKGQETDVSFRIKSVRSNSLHIETVVETFAAAQAVFPIALQLFDGVKTVGEMIKVWLDIQKHLQGEPPKLVQKVINGNAVQIENNSGQVIVINGNIYNAFNALDVGNSGQKIAAPFKRRAESLTIREDHRDLGTYSAKDATSFKRVASAEQPLETTGEVFLTVKSPVLEGDGLWRFRYGASTITARMNDDEFKQQVQSGEETFRNGDIYRVKLKSRQEKNGRKVKTHHVIEKVVAKLR